MFFASPQLLAANAYGFRGLPLRPQRVDLDLFTEPAKLPLFDQHF